MKTLRPSGAKWVRFARATSADNRPSCPVEDYFDWPDFLFWRAALSARQRRSANNLPVKLGANGFVLNISYSRIGASPIALASL
jgi:hypothetical protein